MTDPVRVAALLNLTEVPPGGVLWIGQFDERWIIDADAAHFDEDRVAGSWRAARDQIDQSLIAELFRGKISAVRRAVPYDLTSDAGARWARDRESAIDAHETMARALNHWKNALGRHAGMFNRRVPVEDSRLAVREMIYHRIGDGADDHSFRRGERDFVRATADLTVRPDEWLALGEGILSHRDLDHPAHDTAPVTLLREVDGELFSERSVE